MSSINVLRAEYPGDAAWAKFVANFRPDWDLRKDQEIYLECFKNEDLAIVLSSDMGATSLGWFSKPIPALDSKTPAYVLAKEREGLKVLRSCIMRFPR